MSTSGPSRFRNALPVVDDVGRGAVACASFEIRDESVCAGKRAWIGVGRAFVGRRGFAVGWVCTSLFVAVGVDLGLELLLYDLETEFLHGLLRDCILTDEDIERGETDTSIDASEDVVEDAEVDVEADANVRRRAFDGGLVKGGAKDGGDEEEERDDRGVESHFSCSFFVSGVVGGIIWSQREKEWGPWLTQGLTDPKVGGI